jgi:uncharacterized protein (TIRG00374 family)
MKQTIREVQELGGIPTLAGLTWSRWIGRGLLILGTIMCLYVGAGFWAAHGDLACASRRLAWHIVPTVIALVFLGWGLRSLRWHYYVRRLQWIVPMHHSLLAFFASFAFTATPGKAGEVVKCVLLRMRHDVPLAEGTGVLLVERLGDLLAVLILAFGGLALIADGLVYFIAAALLVASMTILVSSRTVYFAVLSPIARVHRLKGAVEKALRLLDTGRTLLRPIPFLVGTTIALVAWGCEGLAFHVVIRSFGVTTDPLTSCSIFGIATLAGALSALPGGVGSFEVVMVLLLSRLGLPVTAATLPVVLFRFCTLWLTSLLGFILLLGWLCFVSRDRVSVPAENPA